jgi:hypothetical protein
MSQVDYGVYQYGKLLNEATIAVKLLWCLAAWTIMRI